MNEVTNSTIFKAIENWAPKHLAYDWDNVGLQVGSKTDVTKKVMVTLDVLESVVDEAIEKEVNLIIAHHPLLFRPLDKIDVHSIKGKILQKLIANNITVYAAHTNLDIADDGVNDLLCDALQVTSTKNLIDVYEEQILKLVVFVPYTHAEAVREALSNAGAGHIGEYSHCTFQTEGRGTFKPLEGSNPFIGSTEKLAYVDELKIETVVKENELSKILSAMEKAHPYEEVAYDLFPLKHLGKKYGLGRIGTLEESVELKEFSKRVKDALHADHVRVVGDLTKQVQKVAIVGGSGEKFITEAKQMGADVYITGDTTFHQAQDAQEMDLALIDPGHYVEKIMKRATKDYLEKHFTNLPIIASETNTNPFQFI